MQANVDKTSLKIYPLIEAAKRPSVKCATDRDVLLIVIELMRRFRAKHCQVEIRLISVAIQFTEIYRHSISVSVTIGLEGRLRFRYNRRFSRKQFDLMYGRYLLLSNLYACIGTIDCSFSKDKGENIMRIVVYISGVNKTSTTIRKLHLSRQAWSWLGLEFVPYCML